MPAPLHAALCRTFCTTDPIETLNGSITPFTAGVKRWRDGQMPLRRFGARREPVVGYRDVKRLSTTLANRAEWALTITAKPVACSTRAATVRSFNSAHDIAAMIAMRLSMEAAVDKLHRCIISWENLCPKKT